MVSSEGTFTVGRGWRKSLKVLTSVTVLFSIFAAGLAVGSGHRGSDRFDDVPEDHWANEAIGWAVSEGITAGVSENLFDPNGTVTRAQIATFLYRAIADRDKELPLPSRSAAQDWADNHIATLNVGISAARSNGDTVDVWGQVTKDIAKEAERLDVCDNTGASYAAGAAARFGGSPNWIAAGRYMQYAAYGLIAAAAECARQPEATIDVVRDLLDWANAGVRLSRYVSNFQDTAHWQTFRLGDLLLDARTLVDWAVGVRDSIQERLESLSEQ